MASTYTLTEHQVLKKKQEKKFTSSKEFLIELSKTLNITITNNQDIDLYFNIIGIDVAIVNSYRRIILSEVSTMAVDEVHMIKNDSVIPDEVLAHRFGMVPFDIDPRAFFTKSSDKFHNNENETVKFRIEIKNNFTTKEIEKNEQLQYLSVYSDCLKWIPLGQQRVRLVNDPKPICKDILLAKLSQKQEIVADMYCLKSNGMDHAKFSPVATASYKLLSKIEILRDIYGDEAKEFQKIFAPGVIKLEFDTNEGNLKSVVGNTENHTNNREVFRSKFKNDVVISKYDNYFLFFIESTGALKPSNIMIEAGKILINKCDTVLNALEEWKL